MPRLSVLSALLVVSFLTPTTAAAEPTPVEKQLAVQKAMATARQFVELNMPSDAVLALEAEVANADGNKAFLSLLRECYLAELYSLEKVPTPDAAKVEQVRRKLSLLGGAAPATKPAAKPEKTETPEPPPPAIEPPAAVTAAPVAADPTADAAAAFNKGEWAAAERLFASAPNLNAEQKAAWAYCRIKLAAEKVAACDATTAAALAAEVTDALKLVPAHAELQKIGQQVLANANAVAGTRREPAATAAGDAVETPSFRVRHAGDRALAEAVAKAAEAQRTAIFQRWSGPPSAAWPVKCEITIHPTAADYAKATGRPAESTGTSAVKLDAGRATERRIDLRADDAGMESNALPRELTHVVFADLFPDRPAPKWAVEAIAILAGTPEEVDRYTRTLPRCAREGDWIALAQLLDLKDFPAEKITGFYCQSVSLADYLIRAGGSERNFTIFLRDCQRYGTAPALKRTYGVETPQALEAAWRRATLETGRAQAP
ncbi:MAG TPA: hypothetical protein VM529_05755 [Gemmata sp.]|nr:hypothetical protein [Gemmata sp.]